MANINNKLFAYTYAKINDAELLKQYENSLIFIGEEQQIYQPLTNTYIGIGKSAFTELENQINDVTGNKISEVVSYLNKTNTGKISAQYSEEQFINLHGSNPGSLGTYNTNYYLHDDIYTTSNNVVLRGANQFTGVNDNTISGLQNVFANSGINVSINRGQAHRNEYNPLDGSYNVTYYETSYITIDDTYTWSYIGSVNTYITDYAQKVAVEQANRVYKNLLGINDNVYIEKGFSEAFSYNVVTKELVTMDGENVYIKNKDGEFQPVTINENTISYNGKTIFKYDDTTHQWRPLHDSDGITASYFSDFSFTEGYGSMAYYNWDSDSDTLNPVNEYVPIFYQLDSSYTAYANINIADGINTIKEVAYILDLITDGSADDGINLTYNIVKNHDDITYLLNWKEEIGDHSVTSITAEDNDSNLITLTQYSVDHKGTGESTGDVVIETKLNVAPVIANRDTGKTTTVEDPTTHEQVEVPIYRDYAVYDPDLLTDAEKFSYTYKWVYNPNYSNSDAIQTAAETGTTYAGGWFTKAAWDANKSHYLDANGKFIADGSDKVWVVSSISGGTTINDASDLPTPTESKIANIGDSPYIYIPWSLPVAFSPEKDGVLDALTDVRWVTSYVNAAYEDLKGQIRDAGGGATEMIEEEFLKRTVSYAAPAGKYFTGISQDNGILSTYTVADLPSDFLVGDSIVTSYNAKYVKITGIELANTPSLSGNQVWDENLENTVSQPVQDNTIYYVKLNNGTNGFTAVTAPITDINKSIYVLDGNVYKPVSIQDAVATYNATSGTSGISSDFTTVSGSYFYASDTAANSQYLEANSIHIPSDGSNQFRVNANITYVRNATASNTGLADAYDVRKTIEDMFTWIDLRTNAPFVAGA